MRRVELGSKKSAVGTLVDDAVGGPTGGELNGGRGEVGIEVPVDGVGSTTDLAGVSGTWHLALARDRGVLDIIKGTTVAFVSIFETGNAKSI